jgi:conserved domain protein
MKSNYDILGNHIRLIDNRNKESITDRVLSINIDKYFMPSVANVIGTDLSKYKLISKGKFACNPMHVGRDERLPVALYDEDAPALVSPVYFMFEVIDNLLLNEDYLMMWFRRPEFDRICWLKTDGSVRGGISWDDICRLELPVPPIEEQLERVNSYKAITERIDLKQKINDNLEAQAINLYKAELKVCATDEIITGTISAIGEFVRGKNITAAEMVEGNIPVISAGLQPSGHYHKSNVSIPSITVSGSGVNAGYVSFHLHDIWADDCSYNNSSCYIHCLYVMMKDIQAQITELQKGTAQPHVYPKELNPLEITYPNSDILNKLEHSLSKIFAVIENNDNEISKLKQIQTVLLATLSSR